MKYEKNSPVAQKNAQAIEEFLLAEQAKGTDGCSRMEIEIACGLLHNQWDKTLEKLEGRLVPVDPNAAKKNFKYRIEVKA